MSRMSRWMRCLHKWVGLILAIQFLLWMTSGVMMSLLDAEKVGGQEFRVKPAPAPAWPRDVLGPETVLAASADSVMTITSGWLLDRPVYRLQNDARSWLVSAVDGRALAIDAGLAVQLARASYSGPGQPAAPRLLAYTLEARKHKEPGWRVDFDDAQETTVYVSSVSGAVLEHRNSTWRLFDLFWMLHIMDYSERTDFNHPLHVSSAIGGLWMALTGVWLLFTSIRLAEFVPGRLRRRATLHLVDAGGARLRAIDAAQGDTAFDVLARAGLQLPSNCGGGQSCGLCAVRCSGTVPAPTAADRALLARHKLDAGFRLACNLPLGRSLEIDAGDSALMSEQAGTVTGARAVAPFLREITIRPHKGIACRPGSHVQLHVPVYACEGSRIAIPEDHLPDWQAAGRPALMANDVPVRRSYSVSLPVEQADGQLSFLVRFVPGAREKVFIGGGSGMAPLRAMIHALLAQGAREPLHFWYGARSRRDAPYVDEMRAFAEKHPNFRWHLVLSEEDAQAGTHRGLVHEAALDGLLCKHPDIGALEFYLCGPPAMLSATRAMLRSLGVDDAQVACDDFKI